MSCGCGCGGEVVAYEDWNETDVTAAEYRGRKVTLNKPFRTPGASKKFGVYTTNEKGNVVLVRFGDPNMEIRRDDPERRRNFRSRHNCDSPGPKYKARYWSCRQWESNRKVEAMEEPCGCNNEEVKAEMIRRDVFDNPGEAMSRAREMGCDKIHSHEEDGKTVFMPCETHQEYMDKNDGMDVEQREEVESYYHDDDEKRAMMHKKKKKEEEEVYGLHYNDHEEELYKKAKFVPDVIFYNHGWLQDNPSVEKINYGKIEKKLNNKKVKHVIFLNKEYTRLVEKLNEIKRNNFDLIFTHLHYFEELNNTSIRSRFLPLACSYENISNMRYRKLEERKYDLFFSGILQNWNFKHMQNDLRKKIQSEFFNCIYDFPIMKKFKYRNIKIFWNILR